MPVRSLAKSSLYISVDKIRAKSDLFRKFFRRYNRHYEKIGSEVKDITDEIDFDLPVNWSICHFSDIADIFTGNSINEQEKQKKYFGQPVGYNYIGTKDVSFDHTINYCNGVRIPYNAQFKIAHKGMPLLCIEGGSAGRKIGILSEDVCFGNKLCVFETFGINAKFVYYFLQAPFFLDVFKASTTGIIGGVSLNVIKSLYFLLPPLAEQERIVAEIGKYEPLIAEYDKLEQEKSKLDGEIYDKLKKSILQYAIQGKLVPQEPSDESASALLEKIRAEKKAKLGKKYVDSFIFKGDDNCYYEHIEGIAEDKSVEVPFDLPDGWIWERIPNVTFFQEGPGIMAQDFRNTGIPLIRIAGMQSDKVCLIGCNYLDAEMVEKKWKHFRLDKGDVVISTSASMDKIAEVFDDTVGAIPYTGLIRFKMSGALLKCYFKYFFRSDCYIKQIDAQKSGTTIQHYGPSHLQRMLIPLPPLAEQQRIVDKINEIFANL